MKTEEEDEEGISIEKFIQQMSEEHGIQIVVVQIQEEESSPFGRMGPEAN